MVLIPPVLSKTFHHTLLAMSILAPVTLATPVLAKAEPSAPAVPPAEVLERISADIVPGFIQLKD
jgi:hypothetical protein